MATRPALLPILTVAETRLAEAACGLSGSVLMEQAGALAARAVLAFAAPAGVVVACGSGGNGGDGYVVARHLAAAGVRVAVAASSAPRHPDATSMRARWAGPVVALADAEPADTLVDAVVGSGLTRSLSSDLARQLARLGEGRRVIALDIPSGLDADTGAGACLQAAMTVAFGALKPAHQLAAHLCGRVVVANIGLDRTAARLFATAPLPPLTPAADSHKYARGAVLTLGGAPGRGGAARLAARSALRIAGLSLIAVPAAAVAENAARDAVMARVADNGAGVVDLLAKHRFASAIAGPGLEDDGERIAALLASGLPLVLDAGVFTLFAGAPARLGAALRGPAVLTPHDGEFARLFGDLPGGRVDQVRAAAAETGAVVLRKGPATIIAAPDGRAAINAHATPWLATAGSGDVLCGIIAGLLAIGYDAFDAACAGAWLHGDAGRRAGPGLTADDLPAALALAVAAL